MSHVDTVVKYLEYRSAGKNDELVALLADDVVLEHFKDGTFTTKAKFAEYIKKTPAPPGTWATPVAQGDSVHVEGTVKKLMMNWTVKADMQFNDAGLIKHIKVYR
ncbi:hypothetical protein DIPPA_04291 [Diplonema papillatum]|nr:hypothetical protein DIPPA_04291 [Diplonema papillatum]